MKKNLKMVLRVMLSIVLFCLSGLFMALSMTTKEPVSLLLVIPSIISALAFTLSIERIADELPGYDLYY
jgi:hypothetical protein